jgi:hypothetical protein
MKRILGIVLLCACLSSPGRAQEQPSPEAIQAAKELTALISSDTMEQLSKTMIQQMWSSLSAQLADKVDAATLAELRGEVERSTIALATDLMKDAPAIYARNFTVQELHDLAAFYKTPAGAKALRIMPTIMAEIGATLGPRLPAFQQGLGQRIAMIMQKHGYKN